jgi:hypothetical protein
MSIARTGFSMLLVVTSTGAILGDETAPPADLSKLSWLAGSWVQKKDGVETEEHWIEPKGDLMLGVARTVRAGGKTSFEFLRIVRTHKGISYIASPGGGKATEFPLVSLEDRKVVFENKKHDFPQRITYWLDGEGALHARIEGDVNGKTRSMEWRWEKK